MSLHLKSMSRVKADLEHRQIYVYYHFLLYWQNRNISIYLRNQDAFVLLHKSYHEIRFINIILVLKDRGYSWIMLIIYCALFLMKKLHVNLDIYDERIIYLIAPSKYYFIFSILFLICIMKKYKNFFKPVQC